MNALHRLLVPVSAATVLVVTVTLASVPATAAPRVEAAAPVVRASLGATTAVQAVAVAERQSARRRYTPRTGVIHTDPRRSDRRKLLNHIIKSIGATRRRHQIRIISWNINSRAFVDKLINAHRRGVSVRLLMSSGKAEGNRGYWQLRRALRKPRPNVTLPRRFRSWARSCDRSCRGHRGIAHSKLFIFSKVGRAERVVMSTSANATEVAVKYQWNDLFTQTRSKPIYRGFMSAFRQAARDRPVRRGYRTFTGSSITGYVYPYRGRAARGDRVKTELRRITCRGTRGRTGINGRTRIRIA
ncbi:MAG: phospholipase D-like domain-containing protein, partial [Nocardioides sp.]